MNKIQSSDFKRLIGTWQTEGRVFSEKGNLKLAGIDSYEFILDGHYILHKADVQIGEEKSETFEIISLDKSTGKGIMEYYNSKGECGRMISSLTYNTFNIVGNKLRFEGIFNDENTKLTGTWLMQNESNEWINFIDLQLTKQNMAL